MKDKIFDKNLYLLLEKVILLYKIKFFEHLLISEGISLII